MMLKGTDKHKIHHLNTMNFKASSEPQVHLKHPPFLSSYILPAQEESSLLLCIVLGSALATIVDLEF